MPRESGTPPGAAAVQAELDAQLREMAAGLHARARTIAGLDTLTHAVATDRETVQELVDKELALRTQEGETLEIAHVAKKEGLVSLAQIPKAAPPGVYVLGMPGVYLRATGGTLRLSEVVDIPTTENPDVERGVVAVSWPVDIAGFVAKLDTLGVGARLEVDAKPVATSQAAMPSGAKTVTVPLTSAPGRSARLVVEVATGARTPALLVSAGVLALLSLLGAGFLWKKAAPVTARANVESAPVEARGVSAAMPARGSGVTGLASAPTEFGVGSGPGAPRPSAALTGQAGWIGRYSVVKPLGAGGMAEVYLARATGEAGFEKLVALKVLQRQMATQPKVVELFLDEARLASRLTHPNIVQISDLGKAGEDYFIAMEYIEGRDLEQMLAASRGRGAQVPVRVALAILRKICDGLHAAHTAQGADGKPLDLVHRDVKSANVLLSKAGAVKIADFGIAKANQQLHKTVIGEVKGTAAYMAPEHRIGQVVDCRADVYGVGAISYELLTGQEINLDLANLFHLGVEGWPHLLPPSQVRPELPPELDAVVFKALAYDKENRFPTCAAFEEALEEVATRHGLVVSDKLISQWVEAEYQAEPKSGAVA
jgi:hypothetical protein